MRFIVGVMGGGRPDARAEDLAEDLGARIASLGWVVLNGGRACGVMDASARGAHAAGGLVVGVLPDDGTRQASEWIDIPIRTGMGDGRNVINILSSDVVCALPGGAGTLSEVALALKAGRHVVTIGFDVGDAFDPYRSLGLLHDVDTPEEAISVIERLGLAPE